MPKARCWAISTRIWMVCRSTTTLGHDAGDRLLVIAAQRLTRVPAPAGPNAWGDVNSSSRARTKEQQRMQAWAAQVKSIAAPYQIGNHRASVTASIGYTLYPER